MMLITKEEESRIIQDVLEGKYEFIDAGSTRMVFDYDEYSVLKITPFLDMTDQSDKEVQISLEDTEGRVAKVFRYGKRVIISEKIDIRGYRYSEGRDYYREDEIERFLGEFGCWSEEQYGFNRLNKLVAYDYGFSDSIEFGGVYSCRTRERAIQILKEGMEAGVRYE